MMRRVTVALLATIAAAALAGCSMSRALPRVVAGSSASPLQLVTFRITIPAKITNASHGRRVEYVSAATQSVKMSEQPSGGGAPITVTNNCGASLCEISMQAPIGTGTFTISLFDGLGGSGNLLSSGKKTVTIMPNVVNVVGVTFDPVVASIVINVEPTALAIGYPTATSIAIIAKDPSGNTIVGPGSFPAPITITSSDTTGAITFPKNTVTDVDQVLEVDYNGATIANPTFTASMAGLAPSKVTPGSVMLFANLDQIGGDFTGDIPDSAAALDSVPMDESAPLPRFSKSFGQPGGSKALPPKVDLSANMPPPGDQGAQGSCTAFSAGYGVMTYQEKLLHNWSYYQADGVTLDQTHLFSPAFLYNQVHSDNSPDGGGATLLANLTLLSTKGIAPLSDMPYNPNDYTAQPSPQAFSDALGYRIYQYGRLNTKNIGSIKAQLAAGNAVYWAMPVDSNFQGQGPNQPWKGPILPGAGGHAMALAGYDDSLNAFMIRNSWGTSWGTGGYGYIDYNAFAQYADEAFVVKVADFTNPNIPNPLPTSSLAVTNFDPANNGASGLGFQMTGTLNVPAVAGVSAMVGVLIYSTNTDGSTGNQVTTTDTIYNDGAGNLATGTAAVPVGSGVQAGWTAYLPYSKLGVQPGQSNTYAAFPSLFVDGLSIVTAQSGNVFTVTNNGISLSSMARTRSVPASAWLKSLRRQMHFTTASGRISP